MESTSTSDGQDASRFEWHWLVLLSGVVTAVSIWCAWLFWGSDWSRQVAAKNINFSVTADQGTATSGSAASEPLRAAVRLASAPAASSPKPALSVGNNPAMASTSGVAVANSPIDREHSFAEIGQTGDSFGGLNALLTALAGALVLWAGVMQHLTLRQARAEAGEERDYRKRQSFEALFFNLMELSAAVTSRSEGPSKGTEDARSGSAALDAFAWQTFNQVSAGDQASPDAILASLVRYYVTKVYDRRPSQLGPYFRLLFQIFKHIAESPLSEAEKIRYSNIARGQISEGAVLLLALNGLTRDGNNFVPYVERFGLLEHMHRRYRNQFESALKLGYRARSFLGSVDRAKAGNEWIERPQLTADYLAVLEVERLSADFEEDFTHGFEPTSVPAGH